MLKRQLILKISLLVVFLMSFSSALMMGYAYWDDKINTQASTLNIGDWGIPITTAQEFYDFATKTDSVATDRYYLFNDIDFTGFNWSYNSTNNAVVFRGTLDGNGKTLSNLTIFHNSTAYQYIGIFPRMTGGSVYNLTLSNVYLDLGNTALGGTSTRAGLITGNANGLTNTISNITIENAGVRATSTGGAGGLVGSVTTSTTVVNIDNIKATNLKVFNKSSYTGGIVGTVGTSGATVNIADIDIQGEVYSYATSSYTGGIVGRITSGGKFFVNRAIVEMTSQNTLETNSTYNLKYSNRYLGGFIGYNQSSSTNVQISDVFFTGSLYPNTNANRSYVGTALGRTSGSQTLLRSYYSMVSFRSASGAFIYTPDTTLRGISATLVNASTMPSISWWNTFSSEFYTANDLWNQDGNGRLYLIRN
ncbi:MAG: hypothetical protein CVV56_05135 [Tenericutes bacterium HGW-Tenericutes-1]|jgi:hypothetical protein|nr:MAG: hypothetical protein CVV56_05135 [Tenericutes bacterium HGW-Tenericutes-1]